jgi:hypothetical protein
MTNSEYIVPMLTEHGSVRDLTQGAGGTSHEAGGALAPVDSQQTGGASDDGTSSSNLDPR